MPFGLDGSLKAVKLRVPIRASIASGLHCVLTEGGSSAETFSRPLDVTWPAVPEELTDMVEPFTILKFFAVEGPPALAIAQTPFLCPDALLRGGLRVLALDSGSSAAV